FKSKEQLDEITQQVNKIKRQLEDKNITVKFDDRDTHKPGWKFAEYELKGVPVRITIGPRDLEQGTAEVARRDTKEKQILSIEELDISVAELLDDIQENIYKKALKFREDNTRIVDDYDTFKELL